MTQFSKADRDKDSWIDWGLYFGYPDCCIKDFLDRCYNRGGDITEDQRGANNHTGFVPCPECSRKVVTGEISLEDLITDREHPEPFPICTLSLHEIKRAV